MANFYAYFKKQQALFIGKCLYCQWSIDKGHMLAIHRGTLTGHANCVQSAYDNNELILVVNASGQSINHTLATELVGHASRYKRPGTDPVQLLTELKRKRILNQWEDDKLRIHSTEASSDQPTFEIDIAPIPKKKKPRTASKKPASTPVPLSCDHFPAQFIMELTLPESMKPTKECWEEARGPNGFMREHLRLLGEAWYRFIKREFAKWKASQLTLPMCPEHQNTLYKEYLELAEITSRDFCSRTLWWICPYKEKKS